MEYDRECQALSQANKLTTAHYTEQPSSAPCRTRWPASQTNCSRVIKRTLLSVRECLPTCPRIPSDSTQGRIMNLLHSTCVGGLNGSMASARKWEFFFFPVEKKQRLWLRFPAAAMHSGLFPHSVGVEIGHCGCSVINSSLYNY